MLKNLERVRRRPGMYTDTSNPNHLGIEVIDNSVDEAVAGFCNKIIVTLHKDQSLEVVDNGRGMPVDVHPEEKIPAIKLILSRLHAGGKFTSDNYQFSGGLHGVGVSVVNALSSRLKATVRRGGKIYEIEYEKGERTVPLHEVGTCVTKDTARALFFLKLNILIARLLILALMHQLKAKPFCVKNPTIVFINEVAGLQEQWSYGGDLSEYLKSQLAEAVYEPQSPFHESVKTEDFQVEWAVSWDNADKNGAHFAESYVNLIPCWTVNGFRSG